MKNVFDYTNKINGENRKAEELSKGDSVKLPTSIQTCSCFIQNLFENIDNIPIK